MFTGPGKHAVFIEQKINRIEAIQAQAKPDQSFVKYPSRGFPANKGCKQVDGYPKKRIGIIVLQCGKEDEQKGENQVERLHGPNVNRNWF